MSVTIVDFEVELPGGGALHLQTADEVTLWEKSLDRYRADYIFQKPNDLVNLGILLQQQIVIFRCQMAINGMEPEVDASDVPTGNYRRIEISGADLVGYQKALNTASAEMRALEKSLGIDKATREAGGAHTLDNYVKSLKDAAHTRGVHIAELVVEYQRVWKELSWKLRMLYTADAEDRAYHNISPKAILDWLHEEVARLEQMEKDYSSQKGKVFVGKL